MRAVVAPYILSALAAPAIVLGQGGGPSRDFSQIRDAVYAADLNERFVQGTESWVDTGMARRKAAQEATSNVDVAALSLRNQAYWLELFMCAEAWDVVKPMAKRVLEGKFYPSGLNQVQVAGFQAALGTRDREMAEWWFWQNFDDDERRDGAAQNYTRPVARLLADVHGLSVAEMFLTEVDKRLAASEPGRHPGARVIARTGTYSVASELRLESGDLKGALQKLDEAEAISGQFHWIKSEVKSQKARAKLLNQPIPKLKVLDHKGQFANLVDCRGKVTFVEVRGGTTSVPELFRAPAMRDLSKTGQTQYVRVCWKQGAFDGWIDLSPKEEFEMASSFVPDALFVPLNDVRRLGLVRPGTLLLDRQGKVRAYLTTYGYEPLMEFLARARAVIDEAN